MIVVSKCLSCLDKFNDMLIQPQRPNLVELRLIAQKICKASHTFGTPCIYPIWFVSYLGQLTLVFGKFGLLFVVYLGSMTQNIPQNLRSPSKHTIK